MTASRINPCPCCGYNKMSRTGFTIICRKCSHLVTGASKEKALLAWNEKRPTFGELHERYKRTHKYG